MAIYRAATASIFLITISPFAWGSDLAGLWQEYDGDTGKLAALIRIEKKPDSSYDAKIEKVFPDSTDDSALLCTECSGSLHNQPLQGLHILSGIKRVDKLDFDGGEILDPEDGETYLCRIRLSEDGNTIEVTGYTSLYWIGQTEVWRRAHTR